MQLGRGRPAPRLRREEHPMHGGVVSCCTAVQDLRPMALPLASQVPCDGERGGALLGAVAT
eukprot:8442022-Alexandrium_andersonii.AAC.1